MAEEGDAEKMRLFYVALTRAKDRVYVPVALDSGKEVRLGTASPIELYLAKLQPADEALYKALPIANVKRLDRLREGGMVIREIEEGIIPVKGEADKTPSAPQKLGCAPVFNPRRLQSFSGLSQGVHNATVVTMEGESIFQSLPAGVETGQLIHELLEKIDPQTPAEAVLPRVEAITRGRRQPGLVTGTLDLLFEHEGATYLLDWKSNRLPSYGEKVLRQEMGASDYLFQAKLYAEATNRYLSRLGAPPLAGCFYVFLRGFAAGKGGVLFIEPEELRWN